MLKLKIFIYLTYYTHTQEERIPCQFFECLSEKLKESLDQTENRNFILMWFERVHRAHIQQTKKKMENQQKKKKTGWKNRKGNHGGKIEFLFNDEITGLTQGSDRHL